MDKDAVVRKIQKLLEMASRDPDSPESKLAAERAGEMLAKYQIAYASIEAQDEEVVEERLKCYLSENMSFEHTLITILAKTFHCKSIRSHGEFKVIGKKPDVELTKWYFKYIRLVLSKKADNYCHTISDRKSFGFGFVTSIQKRMEDLFTAQKKHMDVKTTDLVVIKDQKVDQKFRELYPTTRKSKAKYQINGHYYSGQNEGRNMTLSRPVNGSTSAVGAIA